MRNSGALDTSDMMMPLKKNYKSCDDTKVESSSDRTPTPRDATPATFTLEEAIEKLGFGRFQLKLSLIFGWCWLAIAMEMMVLGILGSELLCHWMLTPLEEALIGTVALLGMTLGSPVGGWISDVYGRKTSILLGMSWALYYALLSAWSPVYSWILILRGLSGFGMASYSQSMVYYAEFLPVKNRGSCLTLLEVWWGFGTVVVAVLGILVLLNSNWRWWIMCCAFPLATVIPLCMTVPESPHFDAMSGHLDRAMATLKQVAKDNNGTLPPGKLLPVRQERRGRVQDLFSTTTYGRLTVLSSVIVFATEFNFFGVMLIATEMINAAEDACTLLLDETSDAGCMAGCKTLNVGDYTDLMVTSVAEIVAMIVTALIIEKVGRKWIMFFGSSLFAVTMFILCMCVDRIYMIGLLFLARGFIASVSITVWVYASEAYPAAVRGVAMGLNTLMSHAGMMACPFAAQVLLRVSPQLCLATFASASVLSAIAAFLLPFDTKGRALS